MCVQRYKINVVVIVLNDSPGPKVIKPYFMLSSAEHKISTADKN